MGRARGAPEGAARQWVSVDAQGRLGSSHEGSRQEVGAAPWTEFPSPRLLPSPSQGTTVSSESRFSVSRAAPSSGPTSPRIAPSPRTVPNQQTVAVSLSPQAPPLEARRKSTAPPPQLELPPMRSKRNKINNHRPVMPLDEPEPQMSETLFEPMPDMFEPMSAMGHYSKSLVTLRAAIRDELGDLLRGSLLREVIHHEMTLTMKNIVVPEVREALQSTAGGGEREFPSECVSCAETGQNREDAGEEGKAWDDVELQPHPLSKIAQSMSAREASKVRASDGGRWNCSQWYFWWMRLEEPRRTGKLIRISSSNTLDTLVSITILLDMMLMVYRADLALTQSGTSCEFCNYCDWAFQVIYTTELLLNLAAHRQWFFFNHDYKQNWFDLFLVLSGYASMVNFVDAGSMRILRILRLGKALRALRVMTWIKHLRVFVVCMQGSLSPFFWALVMLCSLFMIFSLFFVQMVAGHIQENDVGLSGDMEDMFGSVTKSMLTLYMASTGGNDWSLAYDVISKTGWMGSIIYLFFIAFVQLSMINIITGIFVDAAMQTLAPDIETLAMQRIEKEQEFMEDLVRLCKLDDEHKSGKLTPEQFEEAIKRGRVPMLLAVLGLREDHIVKFFNEMSDMHKDDDGQVDIHEFVLGCMHLKGPGTHFDLQVILAELMQMKAANARHLRDIKGQLRQLGSSKPGPLFRSESRNKS